RVLFRSSSSGSRVFPCHRLWAPKVDTGTNAWKTTQLRYVQGATLRNAAATKAAAGARRRTAPPAGRPSRASQSPATGTKYRAVSRVKEESPHKRPAATAAPVRPEAWAASSRSNPHQRRTRNSVSDQKWTENQTSSG